MSIRVFIAVLLFFVFVLTIAFIFGESMLLHSNLAPLTVETNSDAMTLLTSSLAQDTLYSGLFAAAAILFVFFVVGHFIGAPIRKIVKAMDDFSKNGVHPALPPFNGSPTEIRNFARALDEFSSGIEKVHARDQEVSRVKSDFISTAAHQLRTPLTGIRWALEALMREPLDENQKAFVQSAMDKSHDLVAIVGTLLDISSIESGKYNYKFAPIHLETLAKEVAADFQQLAVKQQVSLYVEGSTDVVPPVRADQDRIKWVLNNLVENAIRYTPSGGSVRLMVSAYRERVILQVRDTGIGIQPKDRDNIFERFYRAPNAISKENAGNGLGLYIARTIATDHGGDLNFESNGNGPGTTFTLSLPVAA